MPTRQMMKMMTASAAVLATVISQAAPIKFPMPETSFPLLDIPSRPTKSPSNGKRTF